MNNLELRALKTSILLAIERETRGTESAVRSHLSISFLFMVGGSGYRNVDASRGMLGMGEAKRKAKKSLEG